LSATYILESLIQRDNGKLQEFDSLAKNIIDSLGGISNLQLAPNGVIEKIYPLTGNEKALGHNILRDDRRRAEALLAVASNKLTLAGPFELIQGGVAVIGRNPVFLTAEGSKPNFWGFTSVLIYLDDLIANTELEQLVKRGYHYQLSRFHPNSGKPSIFAGNVEIQLSESVDRHPINVPNGQWFLYLPKDNATETPWLSVFRYTIVLLISFMLAYLVYWLLRQPERLNSLVKERTEELNQLAFYDPLTGLCNRRLLFDLLDRHIKMAQRNGSMFALLYLDLDQFKRINDTMGHDAGDVLLQTIGKRLSETLRASDVAARIGGDEFCVILPEIKLTTNAARVAKKLMAALNQPIELLQKSILVTPSIGITFAPDDGTESIDLLKNADLAMYTAKKKGRNNYQFFNSSMNERASKRLNLENELRRALEQDEFELHFQPLVSLDHQRTVGLEALIRWRHPLQGIVPPYQFIPVAEDTGLIEPMGRWVITTAFRQIKEFRDSEFSELKVSVNLSTRQFGDRKLLDHIRGALIETRLDPSGVQVEITETLLMQDVDNAITTLKRIKDMGITVAIDDFGTGYSSLSMLKNLPVDMLKIDREFVKDIDNKVTPDTITEVIISMAHKLNLSVVAEGIETIEQMEFLQSRECDLGQGYYFSRPLPEKQIRQLLAEFFPPTYMDKEPA